MIKNKLNAIEKKLKAKLRENYKLFVLQKTTEGLWEYNLNGNKIYYNDIQRFKKDNNVTEVDDILKIEFVYV